MANLTFIKSSKDQTLATGAIWFNPTKKTIYVGGTSAWEPYYGLADASFSNNILTITKPDGSTITANFSDMASAATLAALKKSFEDCDLAAVGASGSFISSVSQTDGKVAASATAFASSVTTDGVIAPQAKAVASYVSNVIGGLDVANNTSTAVAGIAVTVNEVDGKVSKPVVSVTPGTVSSGNGSVVTGGAVYTAISTSVSNALGSVYKVKGTVASYSDLVKITSPAIGDVYNVTAANGNTPAGTNYVWVGAEGEVAAHWDALGGTIDLSPYAKKADLVKSDSAVAGQVVSAVSESDGIITVSRRALVADDIPTLAISKVSGLQTALNDKMAASATGANIAVGGTGDHKTATIAASVEDLYTKVASAAASGVTAFGGKTGAITLAAASGSYPITLAMTNNALGATISGLGTAAAKAVGDFDAAGAAAKVLGDKTKDTATSETVYGAIAKAAAAQSAASAASTKVDTSIQALNANVDNSATATAAGTANSTQIKVSVSEVAGKLTGVSVVAPAFDTAGTASSAVNALNVTGNTSASVKGVTVTVNESAGKVSKPVVAIADGSVASGNGNLVTGGQVYSAIENHVASTLAWTTFDNI